MVPKWLTSIFHFPKKNHESQLVSRHDQVRLSQKWLKPPSASILTRQERSIIETISKATSQHNLNNVTRTNAYWTLYNRSPELHWAFLAHMVSRNAGWNMTDLKSILKQLLSYDQTAVFFRFLEKANYLIFEDAFPQLLLYERSKKDRHDWFYLLPHFGVSSFMPPIWELFIEHQGKDRDLLTVALILNEQHFLEKQVMENVFFQEKVIQSFSFQLQELLGLTHILFPFEQSGRIELAGMTVQQFSSLSSRIDIGKALYQLLFKSPDVFEGGFAFAEKNPHTGSRADYFPDLFTAQKKSQNLYSPTLTSVWPNQLHPPEKRKDWFDPAKEVFHYFTLPKATSAGLMTEKHLAAMIKLSGFNHLHKLIP
ncbi:DUF2515 family protein [Jeotgalibacillus campisalis]|uniref:DUF2515 domain-containing protein n=1 Tax=Jeotgalibacillus campisalis TaxID=220754 RepID=A0A0C2W3A7_9BACL|nr:DUF2515 family protein [Jeotgalibacillus campisalis]KIL51106.1 hypothetical protein KR50_09870 [Jeotgalibacillus campisalis]